jgi:hypothetical protein
MQTENKPLRLIQSSNSASAAPLSCAGSRWLMDNQPRSDNLPATLAESLPAIIEQAERAMAPASFEAFSVQMDRLLTWAQDFNLPATDVEALVRQYRELLGDLPANVLALAIHETLKTWSYRSMPLPGDIRKKAAGEYERIRTIKLRAKTAAMYLRWQR